MVPTFLDCANLESVEFECSFNKILGELDYDMVYHAKTMQSASKPASALKIILVHLVHWTRLRNSDVKVVDSCQGFCEVPL